MPSLMMKLKVSKGDEAMQMLPPSEVKAILRKQLAEKFPAFAGMVQGKGEKIVDDLYAQGICLCAAVEPEVLRAAQVPFSKGVRIDLDLKPLFKQTR